MATYYRVDRVPLDCHSPCKDSVFPRGWRGESHQGVPQGKASLQTGSQPYVNQTTSLMYAFAFVVLCFQTSAIIVLSVKYTQMKAEMAQYGDVIRRLEEKVDFPKNRGAGAGDPKTYNTPKVEGLAREIDHDGGYLSNIVRQDGTIGESSWSSRKLLGKQKRRRRNAGGRCNCNSRINSLKRTMDEAIGRIPQIVEDSMSAGGLGIHLRGRDITGNIMQGPGTHFQWEEPNRFDSGGFRLISNSIIQVMDAGIYIVYSQIAVNGRRYSRGSSSSDPSCGHETVKLRGQQTVVLLTSVITQDSRGQHYAFSNTTNPIYPLDSLSHMGVFHLSVGDKLVVRTSATTHSDRFFVDPTYSYFGVVKIS